MNSNLLISHILWDDHQTEYFVVTSLCPIISRQPSSGSSQNFVGFRSPILEEGLELVKIGGTPILTSTEVFFVH